MENREEKKSIVALHIGMLKNLLKDNGLCIALDKNTGDLHFLDVKEYVKGNTDGFTVKFSELTYNIDQHGNPVD